MQTNGQSSKLFKLIILALLGTISTLLMFLDFPLPLLPSYLKVDFSDVPALMAALIFSPIAGVIVELIKNALQFMLGGAEPIGATANLIAGSLFVVPVAMVYHKYKSVKSVVSGLVTGTIVMAIGMSILNYFFILPAYAWFMHMDMFESASVKWTAVIAGILPFNAIKGIIIGILFVPLFIKLRTWIEQKQFAFQR